MERVTPEGDSSAKAQREEAEACPGSNPWR